MDARSLYRLCPACWRGSTRCTSCRSLAACCGSSCRSRARRIWSGGCSTPSIGTRRSISGSTPMPEVVGWFRDLGYRVGRRARRPRRGPWSPASEPIGTATAIPVTEAMWRRARPECPAPTSPCDASGRAAGLLAVAGVAGQLITVVRELFVADRVGASPGLDAVLVAIAPPLVLAGIISSGVRAALVPAYVETEARRGTPAARSLSRRSPHLGRPDRDGRDLRLDVGAGRRGRACQARAWTRQLARKQRPTSVSRPRSCS